MILKEYDENKISIFNPTDIVDKIENFPKIGITLFSKVLLDRYVDLFNGKIIAYIENANGKVPIYKINYNGLDIVLYMSRVGASSCVAGFEEVIAMGLEKLVIFGTCGVLDNEIDDLVIIVPTSAIRDEGTSYHYMAYSNEIEVNEKYKNTFIDILIENNIPYTVGKVWTTDAIYRETKDKVKLRKEQGCICVDMECSAMSAVSKFRNVDLLQFFYAADNLDAEEYDTRSLGNEDRLEDKEKIIDIALDFITKIANE